MSLPKGWSECLLGDYLFVKNGFAFKSKDYIEEGTSVIRISDINNQKVSSVKSVKVSENNIPEGFELEYGDLLIAMSGATTGKTGVYLENSYVVQNQRVGNIKLRSLNGSSKFRNYLIQGLSSTIFDLAYGGAQPNISPTVLESINIPLPPLNEQKRIAKKLDELLATVESIKTHLDNAPIIIKRFRQSILAAATSGKLTEEWREENENSIWEDLLLGEVLPDYAKNSKIEPNKLNGDTWVLELEDIEKETSKLLQVVKYSDRKPKSTKNIFNKGDVLYGKLRPYLDKVIIAQSDGVCTTEIIPIKANENVLKEYIFYVLKSPQFLQYTEHTTHGLSMPRLGTKAAKEAPFPLPTLDEQKEIVTQVESLFALADTLEEKIEAAKKRVDKLTQSILTKAFRGELVEQDPNDEPAEKLLERIKAEQQKKKSKKRVKRVKKVDDLTKDLLKILKKEDEAISTKKLLSLSAFENEVNDMEEFFVQLQQLKIEKRIEVERRDNEDWISFCVEGNL